MMGPLETFSLRSNLAAAAALALFGVAPAGAVSVTVYWDRADYGFGAGIGVSQATALDAQSQGIQIVDIQALNVQLQANTLPVEHDLTESSMSVPNNGPATITSGWSATNNTGSTSQLYLVYAHPTTNTIVLDGQPHTFTYTPSDVGLTLNNDWVIVKAPIASTSDYAYLPAVSLGVLPNGGHDDFSLFYSLQNPQVFQGQSIDKLGLPKWELAFVSTAAPIPEPSSGLLMFVGLLGIARARRKR